MINIRQLAIYMGNHIQKIEHIFLFIGFLGFAGLLQATNALSHKDISFETISIEQGLSQVTVYSIFQDYKGFMWFGTMDGLNRYDGYQFRIYRNDPSDLSSLSSNRVRTIYQDNKNILWIGTDDGLNRLDRDKNNFEVYRANPQDSFSIGHNYITAIYEDKAGELWVGTNNGLNKYDRTKDRFKRVRATSADTNIGIIYDIFEDRKGILWIGTDHGLNRVDRKNNEFVSCDNLFENANHLNTYTVTSIFEDNSGMFFVGTGSGLSIFIREKEKFKRYKNKAGKTADIADIPITTIFGDKSGTIWIGTQNGLNLYDRENCSFAVYRHEIEHAGSLSENYICSIYEDRSGILWFGTYSSGINKYNPWKFNFTGYQKELDKQNTLSHNLIFAICEGKSGEIWIGSNNGLNHLDRVTGVFTIYRHNHMNPNSLSDDRIRSLYHDEEGNLWIGTYGGLNKFNTTTGRFSVYQNDPLNKNSLSHNTIYSICGDSEGKLWLATADGLNRFDKTTGNFTIYKNRAEDANSLSINQVRTVYQGRDETIWVGTYGGGLNKYNRETDNFTVYKNDPESENTLSSNFIYSIYQGKDGILWVGTYGGGLNKFNPDPGIFTHYKQKDGLPNEVIYGILPDWQGNLWLSTNKGLSKFNPVVDLLSEKRIRSPFRNYDTHDGLLSNEFNFGAYYRNTYGELFFGGAKGFIIFNPDSIKESHYRPPIVLTNLTILNRPVAIGDASPLKKCLTETDRLNLTYRDYVFSFEFSALHYSNPYKNQYAYMLEGVDKDWIYTDASRRFATYTTLKGGTYRFRVSGSNCDGIWNEEGVSVLITIMPPYWETWWFKLGIVLIILLIVVIIYKVRTTHIEKRSKQLQQMNLALNTQIEERRRAESALKESEEKYRTLMENINAGMYRSTPTPGGKFLEVNPALIEMFDYGNREELLNIKVSELFQNPDERIEFNENMKRDGYVKNKEVALKKKDGTSIWCSETAVAVYDQSGNIQYYDGLIEDITERKNLESQIRQTQKMEAIGSLAGGIAHDFNNLLTVINGHAEIALFSLDKRSPLYKDMTEILKCGQRASDLTNQLLAFSRKQPIIPKVIDINRLIANMEKMLRRLIGEDIEIKTIFSMDTSFIKADQGQIEQIFMNLVINARDAITEKTDMKAEKSITIETSSIELSEKDAPSRSGLNSGSYVVIKISDSGHGIREEIKSKIFDPFFTTKHPGKGTGLGLSTVFGIVKQNGGNISVDSDPGKGTTFTIYWPISADAGIQTTEDTKEDKILQGNERILLVEDDKSVRLLAATILSNLGYKIYESSNGKEALTMISNKNTPIDLIITDMIMPEMNGYELAEKLKVIKPDIRIIFTSGYTEDHIASNGIVDESIYFLPKPYSPKTMAKKVRAVLDLI
jgi:PAS domain S-box-containing protein